MIRELPPPLSLSNSAPSSKTTSFDRIPKVPRSLSEEYSYPNETPSPAATTPLTLPISTSTLVPTTASANPLIELAPPQLSHSPRSPSRTSSPLRTPLSTTSSSTTSTTKTVAFERFEAGETEDDEYALSAALMPPTTLASRCSVCVCFCFFIDLVVLPLSLSRSRTPHSVFCHYPQPLTHFVRSLSRNPPLSCAVEISSAEKTATQNRLLMLSSIAGASPLCTKPPMQKRKAPLSISPRIDED
jgi:hypothetical protein